MEPEEDVGILGKIMGFFSGKTSNRESPNNKIKQTDNKESSISPPNQKKVVKPVNMSNESMPPYYSQDEVVDFRQLGTLNWLPNN